MTALTVWAPNAQAVEVELVDSGTRLSMVPGSDGVFCLDAALIRGPYQLRLDGGEPLPDPRAQDVESVHGPCHRVDHAAFKWTDADHRPSPLQGAILYELHVGTFTVEGTFDGAAARLPALKKLGITHVELMPVATFAGSRGWGYDGAALFAPHRSYGGVDGLKRFVDAAHALGLNVLLDVVYNHLGPIGNYLGRFGPYFRQDAQTPWGGASVNLDGPGSAQVRRFILDNALQWLRDYHFDGLRLDAIHALADTAGVHLLAQLKAEAGAALIIAESDLNDPVVVRDRAQGGHGLDAAWSDDLHHALHVALTGDRSGYYADYAGSLFELGRALEQGFVYQGQTSKFRKRPHGKPLGDVPLQRLLGYAQTHDQVGNDALGRRLHHLAGLSRAKAALALVLMAPFTPMLFMGEEWGASSPFLYFTDHPDAQVARATTEGRTRELVAKGYRAQDVSDPQALATFKKSQLDWNEREQEPHRDMLRFVHALIALRRASPELCSALPGRATADDERGTLIYERGSFMVALNLGAEGSISLTSDRSWRLLLESGARISSGSVILASGGIGILGM